MSNITLEEIYSLDLKSYLEFINILDESLNPRSPELLFNKLETFNITENSTVLDLGCRDATHCCDIAEKYGCKVVGVDIVKSNIESAKKQIKERKLEDRVTVYLGDISHLTFDSDSFDAIWCRDVLTHIINLKKAFKSIIRVLKPGGKMLIFHVLKTELLSRSEANNLFPPLATVGKNMNITYFEKSFKSAGFEAAETDHITTEWREFSEERGSRLSSKQLLRVAKLRRNRDEYIEKVGEKRYESELANCHWGVYQMLGKLSPVIYTLIKN